MRHRLLVLAHGGLLTAALALWPAWPAAAEEDSKQAASFAPEDFDSEHIFGFAEGSDIGPLGEREIESTNIASFGTPSLPFNADTETAFRYVITPDLRLSAGLLTDYFQSLASSVFNDRNFVTLSGITAELRWNLLNWRTAPIGLTLSFNPEWRRNDPDFGDHLQNVSMGFGLLIDKEVVPEKFFAALNLIYEPTFAWDQGHATHEQSFSVFLSGSYAVREDLLLGCELRHEDLFWTNALVEGLGPRGSSRVLYFGPNVFVRITDAFSAKLAWALRIPPASDPREPINEPRHQVDLLLSYSF